MLGLGGNCWVTSVTHLSAGGGGQTCSSHEDPFQGVAGWFEDPVRKNLTVQCILLSRYSLLRRWAHGGFLLQTCTPDTLLLQV